MASDEFDGEEVHALVRTLTERPAPTAAAPAERRPDNRWTNVRVHMPSARKASLGERVSEFTTPLIDQLVPLFSRLSPLLHFVRRPGPTALVRMWVALGALHGASMTFWPYPKTYLLGLVLYIFSLGVGVLTGVWGARLAWDARLGAAHTVAVGTVVWSVALVVTEALPV